MKIIRISSLGCPSCIIMNNIFNKIKNDYDFEYEELDFDYDDITKYNAGNKMPVYIFYKDNEEVGRLVGEHSIEEMKNMMEECK